MAARLVVSLSGIGARTIDHSARFSADLTRRGVPLSLLFAPRISSASGWVRERQSAGDALLLHGFDHAPDPRSRGLAFARRAEFAALPAHEAGLRLTAALLELGRAGLATDFFAPPRWLASQGTLTALPRKGFVLCAEFNGVRDLRTGFVHRGRITPPSGIARQVRRGGLIRLAVDANQLADQRRTVLDAVDLALYHGVEPVTYADLLKAPLVRAA
jgi:predicted deacetylase